MRRVVEKLTRCGCERIVLTERGSTFGYGNLVADMRSLVIMRELGYPVAFDAGHSVQLPGAGPGGSGGERRFIPALAAAAVAAGCDALFLEVHPDPDRARCDGPNMLALDDVEGLLKRVAAVDRAARGEG
jgi:2-dehydro-3-deoxyphosphooctonate aldolase (KDO 8-P synthase)